MVRWERIGVSVALLAACGRMNFGDASNGDGGTDGSVADAPPLPATLVCAGMRRPIGSVAAGADLAVSKSASNVTAMWVDSIGAVHALLGNAMQETASVIDVVPGPVDGVAGIVTTPVTTLFVTYRGTSETLWRLDGSTATSLRTETSVASRGEPFTNDDTGIPRTWMRGEPAGLRFTYVDDAGVLKADNVYNTGFPVTGLSSADNDNHGHVTWSEDRGSFSHCEQADIDFASASTPTFGGSGNTSDDCYEPRIDSGPGPTDSIATVFYSAAGTVEMTYFGGGVNATNRLSQQGRAPRIKFDGVQFWVAWIDEPATGGVLRLAKVAQDLTFEAVDVKGWDPAGDEAFELVKTSDGTVYLTILSDDTLSFLRTCP